MDLQTFRARLRLALEDTDSGSYRWSDSELDAASGKALDRYSAACPEVGWTARSGDGLTREFDLLAEPGYLFTLAVEYPIDAQPRHLLPFTEPSSGTVTLFGPAPESGGGNIRLWLAKLYRLADTWRVPPGDLWIVEQGAIGELLLAGSRGASATLNVNGETPALFLRLGQSRQGEFEKALDGLRGRALGLDRWPSWEIS